MARIAPYVFFQEFDNNGNPLAGGKVWTYEAGTSTPKVTYTDATESVANANPVILNASGRADIWLGDGAYKFILTDAADNVIKTVDNVTGDSPNAFGAQVNTLSTNTTITSVYANSTNVCSASITLSLLPAATAGMGFYFTVRANNGAVTIDPNLSETIDGATTLVIPSGGTALIICNGTTWYSLFIDDVIRARGSAGAVIQNSSGTNVATFGSAGTTNASIVGGLTVGTTLGVTGISTFSNAVETAKGADIASAATTDLGAATGNFVHITGTTTITSFGTDTAGVWRFVRFAGALTLTHNATSLILPTGANITTAANDTAVFVSEGSGNWRCLMYQRNSGNLIRNGTIIDRAYAEYTTYATLSVAIPFDDTIPQSTEGTQILSASITPKSTTNRIRARFSCFVSSNVSGLGSGAVAAMFVNSGADAVQVTATDVQNSAGQITQLTIEYEYAPASVSAQTISIRVGASTGFNAFVNGSNTARRFGGAARATLVLEEITA